MTNYEWLIKTGKLQGFIDDMMYSTFALFSGKYKELHIDSKTSRHELVKTCAEWLQAEHKKNVYLRYEDINDFIVKLAKTGEIPISCAQKITDELPFFKTKEIDE